MNGADRALRWSAIGPSLFQQDGVLGIMPAPRHAP